VKYSDAVATIDDFLKRCKENGIPNDVAISNYISFVNYNGSETYFTRGAFLQVVVNDQMCKDKDESKKIILGDDDYIDSFIENMSELMIHYHKPKYIDRAKRALLRLSKRYDIVLSGYGDCYKTVKNLDIERCEFNITLREYCLEILKRISQIQNECSIDILDCQPFIIMNYCIQSIILIFNRYVDTASLKTSDEELKIFDVLKDRVFELN
jgi:hypothetical protein